MIVYHVDAVYDNQDPTDLSKTLFKKEEVAWKEVHRILYTEITRILTGKVPGLDPCPSCGQVCGEDFNVLLMDVLLPLTNGDTKKAARAWPEQRKGLLSIWIHQVRISEEVNPGKFGTLTVEGE